MRPFRKAPAEVLVEDSWISVQELPSILGNFMRSSAQYAREAKVLSGEVQRLRELLTRPYKGSPGFDETPDHITELDALADLYDDVLAADLHAALGLGEVHGGTLRAAVERRRRTAGPVETAEGN